MAFSATVSEVDQHEVLVDHADAVRDGVARRVELDGLPVDLDAPASGRYRPARMLISVDLPAPFSPSSA